MNEIEFKNIDELYKRVKPALYSKVKELNSLGYTLVSEKELWNYLVKNSWKGRSELGLSDLVSDILYADGFSVQNYVVEKLKNRNTLEEDSLL